MNAADTIRRLRNHACLAIWCGGNEQARAPLATMLIREESHDCLKQIAVLTQEPAPNLHVAFSC